MPEGSAIQDLIQAWSAQDFTHAICEQVPWLFVQLPRDVMRSGIPGKRLHSLRLPAELTLPFFTGAGSLDIRWDRYIHVACVVHPGNQLDAGHYTALLRGHSNFWQYDDERIAPATQEHLAHAVCNVYVLLLIRADLLRMHPQLGSELYVPEVCQDAVVASHVASQRGTGASTAGLPSGPDQ